MKDICKLTENQLSNDIYLLISKLFKIPGIYAEYTVEDPLTSRCKRYDLVWKNSLATNVYELKNKRITVSLLDPLFLEKRYLALAGLNFSNFSTFTILYPSQLGVDPIVIDRLRWVQNVKLNTVQSFCRDMFHLAINKYKEVPGKSYVNLKGSAMKEYGHLFYKEDYDYLGSVKIRSLFTSSLIKADNKSIELDFPSLSNETR